jgi:predicted flavoprotein YhiN
MKAPPLLAAWTRALERKGVSFSFGRACVGFDPGPRLRFDDGSTEAFSSVALCLGGASWQREPCTIPAMFEENGLQFAPFRPSNAGLTVDWPEKFIAEAEGAPIKNVVIHSPRGERAGDLVVTAYGLEGTPVYAVGEVGPIEIDLKPDLTLDQVRDRLARPRENLSFQRRVKRTLNLGRGALALLFHLHPPEVADPAALIKRFPLTLRARQPLSEAISSAGGLAWEELDERLMLRKFPGIFAAGEMIDWDAPTGGFLIQACVSSGWVAGQALR